MNMTTATALNYNNANKLPSSNPNSNPAEDDAQVLEMLGSLLNELRHSNPQSLLTAQRQLTQLYIATKRETLVASQQLLRSERAKLTDQLQQIEEAISVAEAQLQTAQAQGVALEEELYNLNVEFYQLRDPLLGQANLVFESPAFADLLLLGDGDDNGITNGDMMGVVIDDDDDDDDDNDNDNENFYSSASNN